MQVPLNEYRLHKDKHKCWELLLPSFSLFLSLTNCYFPVNLCQSAHSIIHSSTHLFTEDLSQLMRCLEPSVVPDYVLELSVLLYGTLSLHQSFSSASSSIVSLSSMVSDDHSPFPNSIPSIQDSSCVYVSGGTQKHKTETSLSIQQSIVIYYLELFNSLIFLTYKNKDLPRKVK